MRKSILTVLCSVLLPLMAGAQADGVLVRARALWFDSQNAAGLLFSPVGQFSTATAGYSFESGEYKLMREGSNIGKFTFDTDGAVKVGKFQLWGRFGYNNVSDRDNRYNCLVYAPADERYLYGAADTTLSTWKRQSYDMEFKLAYPVVEDKLFAGVDVSYTDKIAAKQHDPRVETYNYSVSVKPSLALHADACAWGLNAYYEHSMERAVPTISNTQISQTVFLLRGLGNYTTDSVGSGGLEPMFFIGNVFGGALQFSYSDRTFWQAGADWSGTEVRQSATHPRPMGQSAILRAFLNGSVMLGRSADIHKLSFDALFQHTSGTEYSTKSESGTGWVIASESVMSKYLTASSAVAYDCYLLQGGKDWIWNLHADAGFTYKKDRYVIPVSLFSWSSADLNLASYRRFFMAGGKQILKLGLTGSAIIGLSGNYNYQGSRSDSRIVTEWYPHDLAVRKAQAYGGGAVADWGIKAAGNLEVHIAASASTLFSTLSTSRTLAQTKVYLLF